MRELERRIHQNPRHPKAPPIAAWLQDLADRVDTRFWPQGRGPGYSPYYWDVPDTAVPPIDGAAPRRQALKYLAELRKADPT